jgi:hypothetical protein
MEKRSVAEVWQKKNPTIVEHKATPSERIGRAEFADSQQIGIDGQDRFLSIVERDYPEVLRDVAGEPLEHYGRLAALIDAATLDWPAVDRMATETTTGDPASTAIAATLHAALRTWAYRWNLDNDERKADDT